MHYSKVKIKRSQTYLNVLFLRLASNRGPISSPVLALYCTYTLLYVQVLVLAAALALASTAPAGPPAPYPAEPAYPDLPPVYNVSGG